MPDTLHFLSNNPNPQPYYHHDFPSLSRPRKSLLTFPPPLFSKTTTPTPALSLPPTPTPTLPVLTSQIPRLPLTPTTSTSNSTSAAATLSPSQDDLNFQEKLLYLDSMGIDFFSLIKHHPPLLTTPLSTIKFTVDLMSSFGFNAIELRRITGMCPELLSRPPNSILPIFTFLLRETRVEYTDLRRIINRRPRLLVSSVRTRLRPTLYFLQSIGIEEVNKHTNLLSCSVEDKLVPRIEYFKNVGFSHRDAVSMFRRFPQLFCYSVKENLEQKFNYFVVEMGRDLKELKEFPQYFSFSLENRIKPRHQRCVERGVCFPLPILLKTSEEQFVWRLDICCNSSMPLSTSPLWCTNCVID